MSEQHGTGTTTSSRPATACGQPAAAASCAGRRTARAPSLRPPTVCRSITRGSLLGMPDGSLWAAGKLLGRAYYAGWRRPGRGCASTPSLRACLSASHPALMLDSDGSVWIASLVHLAADLSLSTATVWRPVELPSDDPLLRELERSEITSMLRGQDGARRGWASTTTASCAWTAKHGRTSEPNRAFRRNGIGRLLEDRSGVLWAAAGEARALALRTRDGPLAGCRVAPRPDEPVYSIAQLPDGSLWASGNDSIMAAARTAAGNGSSVATRDDGID